MEYAISTKGNYCELSRQATQEPESASTKYKRATGVTNRENLSEVIAHVP